MNLCRRQSAMQSLFYYFILHRKTRGPGEENNCFERAGVRTIQAHMTSSCINRLCRTVVLLAALLEFSPGVRAELASIFTNAASTASAAPIALPRRTSIIFIQCDGLGYGDLSCYGQTKFQTPNLDRLAAEGIRFTSYYAGDAASSPARAALMTGRDSTHLRQRADADIALAPGDFNVAEFLKQAGYRTGLIGEWGLGREPWQRGFDEFAGFLDLDEAQNYYADYLWRFTPNSTCDPATGKWTEWKPGDGPHNGGKEMLYPNTGGKKGQYIPDLFTDAALRFIQNYQPDPFNHFRPFFLMLNYSDAAARHDRHQQLSRADRRAVHG